MKKKDYLILGIIALSFFWTGSAYISVAYRLMESYTAMDIDIYHVIIGYLLQALGMLLFALESVELDINTNKRYFVFILIAGLLSLQLPCFQNGMFFHLDWLCYEPYAWNGCRILSDIVEFLCTTAISWTCPLVLDMLLGALEAGFYLCPFGVIF